MSETVISVEHLSKAYRLGQIGTGRLVDDLRVWWAKMNGRPNPFLKIGQQDPRRNDQRPRTKDQGLPDRNSETIWALKDVSFEVKQGEVLGIIGRNGAGKSTLLKILTGVTAPTGGQVKAKGRVASLLEVGTGFHPDLTGRENIYLNGSILGMNKQEITRKFDEIVAFAETEQFLDTPVKRYSSGMYVRLAFAVAAHLEPEILLVDEVLAVGDVEFQRKCLGKMEKVATGGRTVLFVSHNMPSIEALCKRVLLLRDGEVETCGRTSAVVARYLSLGADTDAAEVDLSAHPGRSHSVEPAFRKAWVLNADGIKNNRVRMGESLSVYVQFEWRNPVVDPGLGIIIEDERGNALLHLDNLMASTEKNAFAAIDSGIARIFVPNLPLVAGTYLVTFTLGEGTRRWIDYVERALAIHVQPADVFGTGKIPDRAHGSFFVPWRITVERGNCTAAREPLVACASSGTEAVRL
jgi:lipopolysaccharide transport system ATP-binding protein